MTHSAGLYSEKVADQILEHIEDGGTIESACKLDGMPSARTLRRWRKGECESVAKDFAERFDSRDSWMISCRSREKSIRIHRETYSALVSNARTGGGCSRRCCESNSEIAPPWMWMARRTIRL